MAKNLEQWLDEFVDNGADTKDITNWPENAGGGASKIKTVKAGQKIRIDLSKYTKPICYYEDFHNIQEYLFSVSYVFKNNFGPIVSSRNDYYEIVMPSKQYFISMIINQSHTQVLCQAGVCDYSGNDIKYDSLMPTTVIYESEEPIILGESNEVQQNIVDLFPTIEIEVTEDIIDGIICIEYIGDIMPFELVD